MKGFSGNDVLSRSPSNAQSKKNMTFYTPIEFTSGRKEPIVTFCELNFDAYTKSPSTTPMFKDFIAFSRCNGANVFKKRLSELEGSKYDALYDKINGVVPKSIEPTGFVFHESRVGSTLVANLFASDKDSMVFSESAPPASVLLHCNGCSHERQVDYFRATVQLMCRSNRHKRCFFKFQSITVTMIHLVLEAFPNTPWIFLYRKPVETMMSHGKKGTFKKSVCLRSKRGRTPVDITTSLKAHMQSATMASDEAWCAAHLNMLCLHSLRAEKKFGRISGSGKRRGMLLPYESLPGALASIVLPLFAVPSIDQEWQEKMIKNSKLYSKSRTSAGFMHGSRKFSGDSEEKNEAASSDVKNWAMKIMDPTYLEMRNKSIVALQELVSTNVIVNNEVYAQILKGNRLLDWSSIKKLPGEILRR